MRLDAANPLYEFLELSRFVDEIDDPEHLEVGLQSIAAFEARWAQQDDWARDETDLLRIDLLMRVGEADDAEPVVSSWDGDAETGLWLRCRLLEAQEQHLALVELVERAPRGVVPARTLQLVADALRTIGRDPGAGVLGHMKRLAKLKEVERFDPRPTRAALDALLTELSEANRSLNTLVCELDDDCTDSLAAALVNKHTGEIKVGAIRRQARSWLPAVRMLFDAIEDSDARAVSSALRAGARVDDEHADGRTLWSAAAVPGNADVIRALVANGAEVDHANDDGRTPLVRAISRGHYSNVAALLEGGATVSEAALALGQTLGDTAMLILLKSPASP